MKVELKVGDIVEHTTIYYSNRTSFYLIEGFSKSGKKAIVRELGMKQVDGDWMNGNVTCDPEKKGNQTHELMVKGVDWKGQQMLRGRINYKHENGHVNHGSMQNFYKWNGQPIWNNCD